jgi:PBP1b-binding outer membrane lipoprotein LpoB
MKKIAILISTLLFISFLFSSCASTSHSECAAYNNVKKYQKEVKY